MEKYSNLSKQVRWLIEYFFKKCFECFKKINKKVKLQQFMKKINSKNQLFSTFKYDLSIIS